MLQFFTIEQDQGNRLIFTRLAQLPDAGDENSAKDIWINLEDPDEAEADHIATLFRLSHDFIDDSLDPAERPRAGRDENASLIIMRASYHPEIEGRHPEQSYPTVPVGVIIAENAVITVCRVPGLVQEMLENTIHAVKVRPLMCIAIKLLERISSRFITHLEKLDEISGEIEEAMQKSTRNEDLRRILQMEKTLVYFLNSLKANALVLEKLLANSTFVWNKEERDYLTDALIECKQAVEMGEIFTEIIANMSDIYASMISNNMNMVVKFLTAITLVLMAPSIIVGLYGMNVPLPLQESPWALPVIIGGTFGLCWALWRYLQKKHWM